MTDEDGKRWRQACRGGVRAKEAGKQGIKRDRNQASRRIRRDKKAGKGGERSRRIQTEEMIKQAGEAGGRKGALGVLVDGREQAGEHTAAVGDKFGGQFHV